MDILDNELVKKYFCGLCGPCQGHSGDHLASAQKILIAMQQPIKNGERYLYLVEQGPALEWMEGFNECDTDSRLFHLKELRLPDQFQLQREWCIHRGSLIEHCIYCYQAQNHVNAVEEKIRAIKSLFAMRDYPMFEEQLRELVALVEEKND